MNPQFDQSPGLHLPQPGTDNNQPVYNPAFFNAPPQPAADIPPRSQPGSSVPMPQPGGDLPLQVQTASSNAPASPVLSDDVSSIVDDEWVEKARDVALRHRLDPYVQSKELSLLKSQYVKARYNKDIKVSDTP